MANFPVSSRRRGRAAPHPGVLRKTSPNKTRLSKYGFYAQAFSEADLRRLDRGLVAQVAGLEELFQELFERYQKSREAGELSAREYLELREALGKAQEAIRRLRRSMKAEL